MLPFSKHGCYVCWVTILTSVPMVSILLTDWTLMPTLGSFAATLYCSLVSFLPSPISCWLQHWRMHEETMFCFGPHGFVWYNKDSTIIGSPEALYRVVAVHMIFYLLSRYRGDEGNCMLTW